jgi:hypothetical protein
METISPSISFLRFRDFIPFIPLPGLGLLEPRVPEMMTVTFPDNLVLDTELPWLASNESRLYPAMSGRACSLIVRTVLADGA